MLLRVAATLLAALAMTTPALAQETPRSMPQAVPISPSVPDARDVAYPGTIAIAIDASDLDRAVFRTVQRIPVVPGSDRITLLYPEWLPGKHAPQQNLLGLNGIEFFVADKPVNWQRDPVEVHAFHVDLPAGAEELVARLVYTSPLTAREGRIVMTPEMLNLKFEEMTLYPAGYYVRNIRVRPQVTVPAGWTAATALDGKVRTGDTVAWAETDYQTLVDSPIFAGAHYREFDLGHDVRLALFADEADQLDFDQDERLPAWRAMVEEALILFGSKPFDHYTFLVAMTDRLGGIGLEHQRSTEITVPADAFDQWDKMISSHGVHAHELVHAWNGKYRRPATMWTPDFRQPMIGELLWLYEGMTSYWDFVLSARSGMIGEEMVRGELARTIGRYVDQPGRAWRSVVDTTVDPIVSRRRTKPHYSFSRNEEYYQEGALVWLEADMLIRSQTRGKRSLEDFAKRFFAARDGDWGEVTYDFAEIVATLNAVHEHDWATFLAERLYRPGVAPPVRGIELGGYRLAWKDEPGPYIDHLQKRYNRLYLDNALGPNLTADGEVSSVTWDSPAFAAGIVRGTRIVAVDGRAYTHDRMKEAVAAAQSTGSVNLLIKRGDRYFDVAVPYSGGLRWPHLEKVGKRDGYLDELLEPGRE